MKPAPARRVATRHAGSDATRERLLGAVAILVGLAAAFALQVVAPVGVPLYDGVVVQEPYRYLHPTGSQAGSPGSFSGTPVVAGEISPQFAASTTELPPQAQLNAVPNAFTLNPGTTGLLVSIAPVEPPAIPPQGQIAGNVYRFSVTDESGRPLAVRPCEGCLTLFMRAPEGTLDAQLQRFADGAWTDVGANHVPTTGMYSWNVTGLGDFAIVATSGDGGLGVEAIAVGGAAVVLLLAVAGVIAMRMRAPTRAPVQPGRRPAGERPGAPSRGIPSKRKQPQRPPPKPPRTPPAGRSDR